ncbi:MAG: DNA repair protein RadC [Bacteroidales bacterium]|nr:DNA repair protein RadC [Bacteroidales bacterium]
MENVNLYYPIREWAEGDRPREKMMQHGKHALADAELIAILIGSGSRNESAVDLARRILHEANNNLIDLSRMSIADLTRFKGMGQAKAISIVAALELGKRRRGAEILEKRKISSSADVFNYFQSLIGDSLYESFFILLLNRANKIIKSVFISEGGLAGTVADPKKIFRFALESSASNIILCHNHPSGNVQPSDADIKLTKKLKQAGEMLDMPIIDHIILGENGYYSFADEGTL